MENARLQMGTAPSNKTGRDETEKMLKEITQQNAVLRRKLDDASEKIKAMQKKWVSPMISLIADITSQSLKT